MQKFFPLIKVSLNHDMNIFKINTRKQSKITKIIVPVILTLYIMGVLGVYAGELLNFLKPIHLEYAMLSLFALSVSILSLVEGIYKSSSLLFNCKDDNLLLSLPIKRRTILFIRIFKFYIFELLYNSLFLLPAIILYAVNVLPGWTYYLSSIVALLVLPIVPIVLSCFIGFIVSSLSSRFKGKKIVQTIFTTFFLLLVMYISFNLQGFINNIAEKASSLSDTITKTYYPVGAYISLVNGFGIGNLLIFLGSHLALFFITILILGKTYFKVNSNSKRVLIKHKSSSYVIKSNSKMQSFVKKELNRFFSTPVFIVNAGFGLVLFILACIVVSLKFDSIVGSILATDTELNIDLIMNSLPVIMFGFVIFSSFMTSITSSMISLEGKSLNILKSLPVKFFKIVLYKIIAALVIIIPCIIIGNLIIFIRFKFDIVSILLILTASFLMPFISELIGIIVNLKYPKIDATNDTEVVKQSMSAMIATFIGLGVSGVSIVLLFMMLKSGMNNILIILIFLGVFAIIGLSLWILLVKTSDKNFNNINV